MPFEQPWANTAAHCIAATLTQLVNVLTSLPLALAVTIALYTLDMAQGMTVYFLHPKKAVVEATASGSMKIIRNSIMLCAITAICIVSLEYFGFLSIITTEEQSKATPVVSEANSEAEDSHLRDFLLNQVATCDFALAPESDISIDTNDADDEHVSVGEAHDCDIKPDEGTSFVEKPMIQIEKRRVITLFGRSLHWWSQILALLLWWACMVKAYDIETHVVLKNL